MHDSSTHENKGKKPLVVALIPGRALVSSRAAWSTELIQDSQNYTDKLCLEKQTNKKPKRSWWCMTLVPGRQTLVDLCEFETSLV